MAHVSCYLQTSQNLFLKHRIKLKYGFYENKNRISIPIQRCKNDAISFKLYYKMNNYILFYFLTYESFLSDSVELILRYGLATMGH